MILNIFLSVLIVVSGYLLIKSVKDGRRAKKEYQRIKDTK